MDRPKTNNTGSGIFSRRLKWPFQVRLLLLLTGAASSYLQLRASNERKGTAHETPFA
jgi:hypothetical protein